MNIGVSPGIVSENNKGSLIIPLIKRVMTKEYHKTDTSKVFFILPICMKKNPHFLTFSYHQIASSSFLFIIRGKESLTKTI